MYNIDIQIKLIHPITPKSALLNSFLPIFMKSSNSILIFFLPYCCLLILLGNLFLKYITLLAKESNWLIDGF